MSEKTSKKKIDKNLFKELGKCIETNEKGAIVITDSKQLCKLLDNHKKPFTQEEMIDFFCLFWQNISIICGAGAEEDLNKQLTDSLNNNEKVSVNDEYKVFDEEILPHVIEKMNFDFETKKTISEELFDISVIDVYEASEMGNNEEGKEKKGEDIPSYLQFILIFFALCKSKALTENVVLNKLLSKCDFSFTDKIIENFISCCGDKVFPKGSLKNFFGKFHDKCKLNKEQWEQLMKCSDDNAFSSKILRKFFIDIGKNKISIDLIEELLRCSNENSFNEENLCWVLKKCNTKRSLSLNTMKNLIKCCPNEIFINNLSEILMVYEKETFDEEILNAILDKYNNKIKLNLDVLKKIIKIFPNKIFKNHFPEILDKCPAKIFDREFVSEVFKIKNIISSEEVALNFLKCCDKKIFDDECFATFFNKYKFNFNKNLILELIRVSDNEFMQKKCVDIFNKYNKKNLDESILKAILIKFKDDEISNNLLNNFWEYFPIEVIQNNLIKILEKCDKKILDNNNLKILSEKLSNKKSSEESVIWLFNNFPDESVKQYSYKILLKLKGTSSNEEFLNLVLEKANMSSNLLNLLFEKFNKDLLKDLLKKRLVDILKNCSDNRLLEKNCDQILSYFKKNYDDDDDDDDYEISDEVINELVRCVDSIDWIFDELSYFCNNIAPSKELLNTILEKFKSQSKVITFEKFGDLLENFNDEITKNNLIDILQNLETDKKDLSENDLNDVLKNVLNKVLTLYQYKMPVELSFFLFENFNGRAVKEKFLDILKKSNNNILNQENLESILYMLADEKISDDLAKELIRCFEHGILDSEYVNKFLDACVEDFHFDETTTEKFYKCFEKQSVTSEILVKLLNRGFQFDIEVCKENNFQIFDIDIFTSKNYKDLRKNLKDKSAVKNFAALYNSYNKSNIKIGYGIGIGIGLLILLIAGGLSIATFGLGALAVSGVMIAAIAVTAAVGLTVTSVFSSFIHMLRLSLAMAIKNFIEQKYKDNPIDIEKKMKEEIAPDMRFWLKVNESKSKKTNTNTNNEMEQPLLENSENQID